MKTLSSEHLEAVLSDGRVPVAHRALFSLLRDREVSLSDALALDAGDVDLTAGAVHVQEPVKRGPERAPLSERSAALLREHLGGRAQGPLFAGADGRALSRSAAARWSAEAAGASVHDWRYSGFAESPAGGDSL